MDANISALKADFQARRKVLIGQVERLDRLIAAMEEAERLAEELTAPPIQQGLVLTPPERKPTKSIRDRIKEALLRMPDTFGSADVFKVANEDGQGPEILRTTFAPFFTRMKKAGIVVEIQPQKGNVAGLYKRGTADLNTMPTH